MAEINIEKLAHNVAEKAIQKLMDSGVFLGTWISVSEGLPKCNGVYEVTIQTDEGRYTSACYFDGSDTWYNDNRINHMRAYVTDKVVAWMPKPEPYKEDE